MYVSINTLDNCKLSDCIFDLNHNTIMGSIPISTWRVLFFKLQQKGQSTQNEKKLFLGSLLLFSYHFNNVFCFENGEAIFQLFSPLSCRIKIHKNGTAFKPKLCKWAFLKVKSRKGPKKLIQNSKNPVETV